MAGTFYYLCTVLDGCSRFIVAWDVRRTMQEADAEIVLQRGREAFPAVRPHIISDRGSQFVAKDFKEFMRLWQTTHVLCSPHYPQSNGKLERFYRTLKEQAIRPKTPLCHEDARRVVGEFIEHYNTVRLHSAIGFVTPKDMLEGRAPAIFAAATESSKKPAPGAQRTGGPLPAMKTLLANPYTRFRSPERQGGHRLGVKLGQDKALRKRNLSGPSLRVEKSTLPEGLGLSRAFREPFASDGLIPSQLATNAKNFGGFGGRAPFLHNHKPNQKHGLVA